MRPSPVLLVRIIAVALATAIFGGNWDVWWHGAIGRESFWSPPHMLLYACILLGVGLSLWGFRMYKNPEWKRLAFLLFLAPLSAPFDTFVHTVYGIEPVNSPWIIWSPPHLLLAFSVGASAAMVYRMLAHDQERDARRILRALMLTCVLSTLLYLTLPITPLGAQKLTGFSGAFFVLLFIVFVQLFAARREGFAGATLVIAFLLLIAQSSVTERFGPGVIITPHDHPPFWLMVMAFITSAAFVDLTPKIPAVLRGAGSGFLFSFILYGFATFFFQPAFHYGADGATIMILTGTLGGALAGGATLLREKKWS